MNNLNNTPVAVLRNRKMTLPIFTLPTVLGRNDQAVDVYLFHESISREHCIIEFIEGMLTIKDLGSTVGTFINGGRIEPGIPYQLEQGCKLKIGKVKFNVEINAAELFARAQNGFNAQPQVGFNAQPQAEFNAQAQAEFATQENYAPEPKVEEESIPGQRLLTVEARELAPHEYDESEVVLIDCGLGSAIKEESIEELPKKNAYDAKETQSMDMEEAEEAFAEAEEEVVSNLLEADDESTVILSVAQAGQTEEPEAEESTLKTTLSWIDDESGEIMRLVIDKYPFSIGRKSEDNDYVIRRKGISRKHMSFDIIDGDVCIRDENSTNGVRIRGEKIEPGEYAVLESGDGIRAGGITFAVKIEE